MSANCNSNCECGVIAEIIKEKFDRMLEEYRDEHLFVCCKHKAYHELRTSLENSLQQLVVLANWLDERIESDVSFINQVVHRLDNSPKLPLQLVRCGVDTTTGSYSGVMIVDKETVIKGPCTPVDTSVVPLDRVTFIRQFDE